MYRLFLALRYLRSRLVNLISVGGVMAGVAVLIIVTAIMDGFQDRVRRTVRGSLSDLTLIPMAEPLPYAELEARLVRRDRVIAAAPQIRVPIAYFYDSNYASPYRAQGRPLFLMDARGIDWERERKVSELGTYLQAATDFERPFFHPFAEEREKKTVVISRSFAEKFLTRELADAEWKLEGLVGQPLHLSLVIERSDGGYDPQSYDMVISGVYDGGDNIEDVGRVYVDLRQLRQMARTDVEYSEVRVKLTDYQHAEAVQAAFGGLLPEYRTLTWEDQRRDFLKAVENEKVLLVIVLSFIVLLGGFIILATLTLTVVEKTRDIGILSALGASRRGVLSVFVWTGLLIGVIGSGLGLALGRWFVVNVNVVKTFLEDNFNIYLFPPDIYRFRGVPWVWSWPTVFWILAGSTLMAFFAGLLPALRAARLDPVKALRHE